MFAVWRDIATAGSEVAMKAALSRVEKLSRMLLLPRFAFFGSSAPDPKVGSHGYNHQDNFKDIQTMGRDERVGQRRPWHEEKSKQRHEGVSKRCRNAVACQPHEEKRNAGSECEGDKDPAAHDSTFPFLETTLKQGMRNFRTTFDNIVSQMPPRIIAPVIPYGRNKVQERKGQWQQFLFSWLPSANLVRMRRGYYGRGGWVEKRSGPRVCFPATPLR
jgi:hypothetical protein